MNGYHECNLLISSIVKVAFYFSANVFDRLACSKQVSRAHHILYQWVLPGCQHWVYGSVPPWGSSGPHLSFRWDTTWRWTKVNRCVDTTTAALFTLRRSAGTGKVGGASAVAIPFRKHGSADRDRLFSYSWSWFLLIFEEQQHVPVILIRTMHLFNSATKGHWYLCTQFWREYIVCGGFRLPVLLHGCWRLMGHHPGLLPPHQLQVLWWEHPVVWYIVKMVTN